MRHTHTYAILKVSSQCFQRIQSLLEKSGYSDQFDTDEDLINMHGIALQPNGEGIPGMPPYEQ